MTAMMETIRDPEPKPGLKIFLQARSYVSEV